MKKIKFRLRMAMIQMLTAVETLNELRTGKRCKAVATKCAVIGFGYFSEITDTAKVEHYLLPFTRLTIYTWHNFEMPNATANA